MDWVRSISVRYKSRKFRSEVAGTGMVPRTRQALRYYPVLLSTVGCIISCSSQKTAESSFLSHLPQSGEADGWSPAEPPQHVAGEDLFLLINGGAEIYHEYGFEQAAVLSYSDDDDRSLNLEVYEMKDPAGAYGIFTFKRGNSCQSLDIGDGSCLQDYYLNLWKGRYLITVIGFDTEQETRDGLISLARSVAKKIDAAGNRPPILAWLPREELDETSIRYLRGNLALFRTYEFGTGNVFGVTEGVTARVGEQMVFAFRYSNESEASSWFDNAFEQLSQSEKFRNVAKRDGTLLALDANDQHLAGTHHQNCIVLVLGDEPQALAETLEILKQRISNHVS
jgi:hypothetical protein